MNAVRDRVLQIQFGRQCRRQLHALGWCLGLAAALPARAGDFESALAVVREARTAAETTGMALTEAEALSDAFFAQVDVAGLPVPAIAAVLDQNVFSYGKRAPDQVRATVERLNAAAKQPSEEGALAAALRLRLGRVAGVAKETRAGWAAEFLAHAGFEALLEGAHGSLALDVACDGARTASEKEQVIALAEKLSETHFTAAARSISSLWGAIQRWIPEGERRQTLRARLATCLAGALADRSVGEDRLPSTTRMRLERELTALHGPSARGELLGRTAPEIEFVWSSRAGLTQLSALRGKVVVLDFWATWCGPCVASFPELAQLAARYEGRAVEIVGVTSLQGSIIGLRDQPRVDCRGEPEKEMRLMTEYVRERGMTWPVVFSRQPVFNPDYAIEGIPTLVLIAPDGTVRRRAAGFSLRDATKQIDALLREFGLPAPEELRAEKPAAAGGGEGA